MVQRKWNRFDQEKGSRQKRPPTHKWVLVMCEPIAYDGYYCCKLPTLSRKIPRRSLQLSLDRKSDEFKEETMCDECTERAIKTIRDAGNNRHCFCKQHWEEHVAFTGNDGKPYGFGK